MSKIFIAIGNVLALLTNLILIYFIAVRYVGVFIASIGQEFAFTMKTSLVWMASSIAIRFTTEWYLYASGLGTFYLPLICVIDPNDSNNSQDRTAGVQDLQEFYSRLLQYASSQALIGDTEKSGKVDLVDVILALQISTGISTTDVMIKGADDCVRTSKQQDYKEVVMNAKLEAIERAGVEIQSITKLVNFETRFNIVESKAKMECAVR